MFITYNVETSLTDAMQIIEEVKSETGLKPFMIARNDLTRLEYNEDDARKLINREITPREYTEKHQMK